MLSDWQHCSKKLLNFLKKQFQRPLRIAIKNRKELRIKPWYKLAVKNLTYPEIQNAPWLVTLLELLIFLRMQAQRPLRIAVKNKKKRMRPRYVDELAVKKNLTQSRMLRDWQYCSTRLFYFSLSDIWKYLSINLILVKCENISVKFHQILKVNWICKANTKV